MAKVIRNLVINDVSSVPEGAGRGVRVVLAKAADQEPDGDELPEHLSSTAAGQQLIELVAEHRQTEPGRKLTARQALAAVATKGDGARLHSDHTKQLEYLAAMGGKAQEKTDMQKAEDFENIAKASSLVLEDITKRVMADNPGMSKAQARAQATLTPEYSAAHRAEKEMRHGPGY
jgi:hypothetical protein